jgi:hypothetical protein
MKPATYAVLTLGTLLALAACQKGEDAAVTTDIAASWPASLNVIGDGFPNPGDACRKIGETEATVNYLDDTATLAGCLSADDAAKLGGAIVGTVEGVTLVSVPMSADVPGDGDGQGDAKVAGTDYNATGLVKCSGYKGAGPTTCDAGVVRNRETGSYVDVTLKDGTKRTILFDKSGKFLSFSTAEADGTAAMKITSKRDGDTTIATLGSETYEIPDVFVLGD